MVGIREIRGVGEAVEKKLSALGIKTSQDILDRLPVQYVDMSVSVPIEEAMDGSFCLFDAVITEKHIPRRKGKFSVFSAVGKCGNLFVRLVWFNHSFASKRINVGEAYTFFGKMRVREFNCEFNNPLFERKGEATAFKGVYPVYATKGVIGQGVFRKLAEDALNYIPESIISEEIEIKYQLMSLKDAYISAHKPTVKDNREAVKRIALEKLTERIAAFRLAKKNSATVEKHRYAIGVSYGEIMKNAGFELTPSQNAALKKITALMKSKEPMNAVLCGDVGSGKTVVAALAAFFAVRNGYQAAIAAPTEILAEQHFKFFMKLFKGAGINVSLLLGSTPAAEKKIIYGAAKSGDAHLVVGTHAVFSDRLEFKNLSLAVADEQHRFGVAQRNSLIEKGVGCDVLTLSATPIPRTMCLAAYGEAEFITIDRRSYGNIKTSIVPPKKRVDMMKYLAKRIEEGVKVYVVAPRISDAEGIENENCEELIKELSKYLPEERIGLLHGKMRQEAKNSAMEKFRDGITPVLVATTVVEVGVDVPDASIIVVTDADKFGLATLHQLRGRVGRDGRQSYCFLCGEECDRLKILVNSNDGFKIAEEDFSMRGGGEIFGLEQSGGSTLKYIDAKALFVAKDAAETVDTEKFSERLKPLADEFSLSKVTFG